MGLTVIDRISDPGGGPDAVNEDIAGHSARAAWVLDGATGLSNGRLLWGRSDAASLVGLYDGLFCEHADDMELDTRDLVSGAIEEVGKAFRAVYGDATKDRHELPSAGMALVRLAPDGIEFASLGDCRAILELPDGRIVSTRESRLTELDGEVLRKMEMLRRTDQACNHAAARQAVDGDLRSNRGRLNTQDGYWVLSIHKEAAAKMEIVKVPLAPGDIVTGLLISDGLYRLVDTFREFTDDATLLAEARRRKLRPLLERLRKLEDADPDCAAPVRFKQKDDATGLIFQATATTSGLSQSRGS
jgi:Protein phosphatase 2C